MPYRTLVCYKETWAGTSIDPSGTSTGTWRDERFWDEGQEPENSLTGTMFQVDAYRLDTISVPYDFSQFRFWRNTGMSTLQVGETGALVGNLLGYEWDSDVDNGFRPAGLINLSLTTVEVDTFLMDFGSTVGPGEATHSLTMYRAESGAIVFGAGTVYWSWGLDDNHDNEPTPTDPNVQQAMVNLFADMGIQPDTLEASLVLAAPSSDALAPSSQISAVFEGATFVDGQTVTITGTAADGGGGKVAGIEVSLDGGNSWRKATGRETWSYTGQVGPVGSYPILSRAVDDSLNLETPGPGRAVTVTLPETSSFWTYADVPADLYVDDNMPIELGLRFTAQTNGSITGVRFYKSFLNQGQHTAHLWTASGTLLAAAPFTNETTSGWQSVSFAQPVAIAAGTTYVASYHSAGRYSVDTGYFDAPRQSGPLTASNGAGVYGYGDVGTFPDGTYLDQNYWVDVVFQEEPNQPPVAVADAGFTTAHETPLVLAAAALTANDTDANGDPLTITAVGSATNGSVVLNQAAQTVTFTPDAGYSGAAGFDYTISDGRGRSGDPVLRRSRSRGVGCQVPGGQRRHDLRHPLLQGAGEYRRAYGAAVDRLRHRPRDRHLHQRDGQRLADGELRQPGRDRCQHDLCRVLPHQRQLRAGCELFHRRDGERPAARAIFSCCRGQWRLRLRRARQLPEQQLQQLELLGRRRLQRDGRGEPAAGGCGGRGLYDRA
jgi:hypothetical protein